MARTKISEFSATPASNTDIDSIFIGEGMAPSNVNDAIRELMAQLKDWNLVHLMTLMLLARLEA